MKKIKLFCIPYSGGMAGVYYKWKKYLISEIELCPVEAAGHGKRMREGFYDTIKTAADDLSNAIMQELQEDEPYAVFGHSLGALYAFEVYFALKSKGVHEPVHIFFSGRSSPDDTEEPTEYYKLPEDEFMKVVISYGGGTGDLMNHRELLDLFVPILRADFRLGETYVYKSHNKKIMCDMTILNGTEDFSVQENGLKLWGQHGGKRCSYEWIKGGHFFITENVEETAACINRSLMNNF